MRGGIERGNHDGIHHKFRDHVRHIHLKYQVGEPTAGYTSKRSIAQRLAGRET